LSLTDKELANQLLEAGVHFGHQTRKWNPKMGRYIYGSKNGVHIIDLEKTIECIREACDFLKTTAARGGKILFVGTKAQAREIIKENALKCGMPFVINRWLGGLLTNFDTLRRSVRRYLSLKEMTTDGTFDKISKKEASGIKKEIAKLEKNLIGVAAMEKLPAALFVVDAKLEIIAVREAYKLGIPVVALADTDADPKYLKYPIPANEDAVRSVRLLTKMVTEAIQEGLGNRAPQTGAGQPKAQKPQTSQTAPAVAGPETANVSKGE